MKGNQWRFGLGAHVGVDVNSGLVHTVIGTAATYTGQPARSLSIAPGRSPCIP